MTLFKPKYNFDQFGLYFDFLYLSHQKLSRGLRKIGPNCPKVRYCGLYLFKLEASVTILSL